MGLVTAACLAELGHTVRVLEADESRLASLCHGELPIYEPDLEALFKRHYRSGRLTFTGDYSSAIPQVDFALIAVNTPSGPDGRADNSFVLSAARSILQHARPGLTIVVKSTVPVGTGDLLARLAADSGPGGVQVVSNPEFLREGTAVSDFLKPDRIVIGAEDEATAARVAPLFAGIDAPVLACRRSSAELGKYASNALLAARISFMNEIAGVCARSGAGVEEISRIVGADRRIGPAFLQAGLGWGGSCLPKDVRALIAAAEDCGQPAPILRGVIDVNLQQRQSAFDLLRSAVGSRPDATVGVLGLAFKPGTDDIREAPAIDIIARLIEEGIHVRAHDPAAIANARRSLPNISYCRDAYEVADRSDALLLATEWPEYCSLDWEKMRSQMRGRLLLDGRHALDKQRLTSLGFHYQSLADYADPASGNRTSERHRVSQQLSGFRTQS